MRDETDQLDRNLLGRIIAIEEAVLAGMSGFQWETWLAQKDRVERLQDLANKDTNHDR